MFNWGLNNERCKNERTRNIIIAMALSIVMVIGLLSHVASAAPAATARSELKNPGENGYVSLHKYVASTDLDDVYKVTLSVNGTYSLAPILVTIVLDLSGSMKSYTDIDGQERYKAVAEGARAALSTLVNSGNSNIWVNIIAYGEDLNTSAYDYPSIDRAAVSVSSMIDNSGGSLTWNGYNTAFLKVSNSTDYQLLQDAINLYESSALNDRRPSGMSGGTWIGAGEKQAHDDLMDVYSVTDPATTSTLASVQTYLPNAPEAYKYTDFINYVMILTDGGDNASSYVADTITWSLALKAPIDKHVTTQLTNSANFAGHTATTVQGAGATVWSVLISGAKYSTTDYSSTWKTDWFIPIAGGGGTLSSDYGEQNYPWMQQAMISVALAIDWDHISSPYDPYGSTITTLDGIMGSVLDTNGYQYEETVRNALAGLGAVHMNGSSLYGNGDVVLTDEKLTAYFPVGTMSETTGVFRDFADAAVSQISEAAVHDMIGNQFTIYQYPGKDLFEITATGTPTDTTIAASDVDPGSAVISGQNIKWTIGEIIEGMTYTLVYYVKIDSATASSDLYYAVNEYAYLTFTETDSRGKRVEFVIYFPQPYVKVTGEIMIEEAEAPEETYVEEDSGYWMTASYGIPYGTSNQPYTPSVTPAPTTKEETLEIEQEELEEYAKIDEVTEEMPEPVLVSIMVTRGNVRYVIIFAGATLILAVIYEVKRKFYKG